MTRNAALGALLLSATLGLTACGSGSTPAPGKEDALAPTSSGPFVQRPTSGVRPPSEAPRAPAMEHYGAEPAEGAYDAVIPTREHWPAPNDEAPGEGHLISSARKDEAVRSLVSTDEVAYMAMRDLFTWDARATSVKQVAQKMSTWLVEEANPVVAEEVSSRWAQFETRGTRAELQDYQDASEWGTPADSRDVSYRAAEVTVRLTDADGTERVEQWIAFITLTTSGEAGAGTKLVMSYRLALS